MPDTGAPLDAAPLSNGRGGHASDSPRRPPSGEGRVAAPDPAPAAPKQRRAFARLQPACAPLLTLRGDPSTPRTLAMHAPNNDSSCTAYRE
jgi:hypothetical protein